MLGRIESIRDERIVAARALATRSGREAAGRCLVEGSVLIGQLAAAGAPIEYVLCPETAGCTDTTDDLAVLTDAGVPVWRVRDGLLRKLTGTTRPADWLAVAPLPLEAAAREEYGDFAVVCERVVDPGNLGTLVRTASALGARDIALSDEQTDLFSRKVINAARGAVLSARVHRFTSPSDAIAALRDEGFQIVAASPRGSHVQSLVPLAGRRVALIVGNETEGVSEATLSAADLVVQIPMAGGVESLNVGVAAGISIYELRMRMIMTMLTDRIRGTLGRNMSVAAMLARQALDAGLQQVSDLTATHAVLLMVLACDHQTPCTQLAREIGVGAEELTGLLTPLTDHGYLTTSTETVTITSEGERAIAALWTIQERVDAGLYEGFSPDERDQLQDLLTRVQNNAVRLTAAGVSQDA